MSIYTTKAELYAFIDKLRIQLKISPLSGPLNLISVVQKIRTIDLLFRSFDTPGFCGMAFVGKNKDTMVLNAKRGQIEQNFDCAHELIHLTRHRNLSIECFQCFDSAKPTQNKSLEWQANEGAAELLMPYKAVLPIVNKHSGFFESLAEVLALKEELIHHFAASPQMVNFRLESLKYEIQQHMDGIEVEQVQCLSQSRQRALNIHVDSINDIENELLCAELEGGYSSEPYQPSEPKDWQNHISFVTAENNWLYDIG